MICILRRISRIADPDKADNSRPSKLTVPPVGSISRTRHRPRVVLPQPDSPTNPSVSPLSTSRLTPSIAFTYSRAPPSRPARTGKHFVRSLTSSKGILRSLEACDVMTRFELDQRRLRLRAARVSVPAPVTETAARWPVERIGDHAGNGLKPLLRAS